MSTSPIGLVSLSLSAGLICLQYALQVLFKMIYLVVFFLLEWLSCTSEC